MVKLITWLGLTCLGCALHWSLLLATVDPPPNWSDTITDPEGQPVRVIDATEDPESLTTHCYG
jgi:hypothetical protein